MSLIVLLLLVGSFFQSTLGLASITSGVIVSIQKVLLLKLLTRMAFLLSHEQTVMYGHAAERADLFIRNFNNPPQLVS